MLALEYVLEPLSLLPSNSCKYSISQFVFTSKGFPDGSEVKASACNEGGLGLIPGSRRSPGEGNGNPLQYPCLENLMDGGAWWATVHGVTKSQTRLSDFTFTFIHLVFLPGESQGWESLVGSHRVGHDWSDLVVALVIHQFYFFFPPELLTERKKISQRCKQDFLD